MTENQHVVYYSTEQCTPNKNNPLSHIRSRTHLNAEPI